MPQNQLKSVCRPTPYCKRLHCKIETSMAVSERHSDDIDERVTSRTAVPFDVVDAGLEEGDNEVLWGFVTEVEGFLQCNTSIYQSTNNPQAVHPFEIRR